MPGMEAKRAIQSLLSKTGLHVERIDHRPEAFKVQRRILGPDVKLIFDVGANVGQAAKQYAEIFPAAHIHCFEPLAESFKRIPKSPRFTAHPLAVANKSGKRRLNICRLNQVSSLLNLSENGATYLGGNCSDVVETATVETVSLDEFCQSQQIDHLDILKLTIQGSELLAIQGAERLLDEKKVDLVYCDVLFAPMYESQASFDDIWRTLETFGYRLYDIFNLSSGQDFYLSHADAIFVRPGITMTKEKWLSF